MAEATLVVRLDGDGRPLSLAVRKANGDLVGLGAAAAKGGEGVKRGLDNAAKGGGSASRAIEGVKRQLLGLATVAGVAMVARQLGQMADVAANLKGRLSLVTSGTAELAQVQDQLFGISQRTFGSLESTSALYTRMAGVLREVGASTGELLGLTETISQAMAVSGASSAEQASAVMQLGQAFASGKLAGEEFNAVNEAAPRLMQALAQSLGVPRGALKKMAEDGELTANVLRKAFSGEQAAKIAGEFEKLPLTIGRAWTQLENVLLKSVGDLDATSNASATVAQAIQVVAQAIQLVLPTLQQLVQSWTAQSGAQLDVASTAMTVANGMKTVILGVLLAKNAVDVLIDGFKFLATVAVESATMMLGTFSDLGGALRELWEGIKDPANFDVGNFIGQRLVDAEARIDAFTAGTAGALAEFSADVSGEMEDVGNAMDATLTPTKALEVATLKLSGANGKLASTAGKAAELTAAEKRAMKDAARAALEHFRAIEEVIQAYNDYETAQEILAEGFANETALLKMSNGERAVAVEMLRFMQDNYDHLTGLTDDARAAEIARTEATIRGGLATRAAAEEVQSLVDEFGRLDDLGFLGLIGSLEKVRKQLAEVSDETSKAYDPKRAAELRETIVGMNFEIADGTVGSLRAATDAMGGLFEEGSKGQRKMQQASALLGVVQAALASVEAVRAIMAQGTKGDPYSAFARMAAMAGAVAPLIAAIGGAIPAFGGGGGSSSSGAEARQERQGRGTVLGDAEQQSESMLRALDITANATQELVGLNRGMLTALQTMQHGIGNAAGSLARTGFADLDLAGANTLGLPSGSILGRLAGSIFGGDQDLIDQGLLVRGGSFGSVANNPNASSYQTIETDGGWFGSDDVDDELEALGDDVTTQIRLILTSIGDAVREGALALGLDMEEINRAIAAFRIEEIRISTMDLTGEEAQAELEAAFSAIFDNLAGAVVPFIDQFQRVGEGLGETLVRVATSVQVAQEAVFQLGLATEELDPERLAQVSVGLIDAAGGIEEFIAGLQSFVSNFAPESHRFAVAQDELTRAFAEAGLTLPDTREGMWALMQSLDRTTESGQAQIAMLLRLSGAADAYYDHLEDGAEEATEAAERAADAERERAEAVAEIVGRGTSALAAASLAIGEFGLSPLAIAQAQIARETQQALADATRAGATAGDLASISMVGLARSLAATRMAALEFGAELEEWAFEDSLTGMDDVGQQLARNDRKWQARLDRAVEIFGEGSKEVMQVLDLWSRSNGRIRDSAEEANNAVADLADTVEMFSRAAANASGQRARQSWAEILTEATIGVRGDGLTEQQRAIKEVNERFSGFSARLQEAFLEALPAAQAFGRDDELRAELEARLGQLEALRLEALGNIALQGNDDVADALEERYRRELDWIAQVRNLVDDIALDEAITTLNPQERLAEAQRQYDVTRLGAIAGDVESRQRYAQVVQELLRQGREYWGSSADYSSLFDRVMADQANILASAPSSASDMASTSPAAAAMAPVASGIEALRTDTKAGNAQVVTRLEGVEREIGKMATAMADLAREQRRANDLAKVRA